jgi:hypothetical protein
LSLSSGVGERHDFRGVDQVYVTALGSKRLDHLLGERGHFLFEYV